MVAAKARGRELVAVLAAALRGGARAGADLHGLHGVDAHEGVGNVRVQPVEHRLTQSRGHPARTTVTRPPIGSPAPRTFQISSSSSAMRAGSGQKNGFW